MKWVLTVSQLNSSPGMFSPSVNLLGTILRVPILPPQTLSIVIVYIVLFVWFLLVQNRQYEDCVRLECSCILIAIAVYLFSIILMWHVTGLLCSSPVEGGEGGWGFSNIGYAGMCHPIGSRFLSLMYSFRPGILGLGIILWQISGYH